MCIVQQFVVGGKIQQKHQDSRQTKTAKHNKSLFCLIHSQSASSEFLVHARNSKLMTSINTAWLYLEPTYMYPKYS